MIWADVNRKSGPKATISSAGKTWAQYVCWSGIVATKISEIHDAKDPIAMIYCAAIYLIAFALSTAATAPKTAKGTYAAADRKMLYPRTWMFQAVAYHNDYTDAHQGQEDADNHGGK